jgi:hypothetical protein
MAGAVGGLVDGATNLPPPIRKNLFKALDQLCTAAIDIPVAYLEGKAAERRAETQARVSILGENAHQIASSMKVNPEYAQLASDKYARRIVQEQINLDKVSKIAAGQLTHEYLTGNSLLILLKMLHQSVMIGSIASERRLAESQQRKCNCYLAGYWRTRSRGPSLSPYELSSSWGNSMAKRPDSLANSAQCQLYSLRSLL